MRSRRRRTSLKRIILSLLGLFLALSIFLGSAAMGFWVFRVENANWELRRREAVLAARDKIETFLGRVENRMAFTAQTLHDEPERDQAMLQLLLDSDPAFYEVVRLDSAGNVLNSVSNGKAELADPLIIRQSAWFSKPLSGGVYTGPLSYTLAGEPFAIVALSGDGKQVLAARISLKVFGEVVDQLRFGSTGRVSVLDQQGLVLAAPHQEPLNPNLLQAQNTQPIQIPVFSEEVWNGSYRGLAGEVVFGSAAHIAGTDWTVVAEVDRSETYRTSQISGLIALLVTAGLGTAALYFTSKQLNRKILQPLAALRGAAEKIRAGERNVRVPVYQADEIGDLASSFNSMSAALQEQERGLMVKSRELQREILSRQTAQQELERRNKMLEDRVMARTLELSETRQRFQESENRFSSLVENIPAITYIATLTHDGPIVVYVSPQIEAILGFSTAEWKEGFRWTTQIHADDLPLVQKFYEEMLGSTDHYALEYRMYTLDGKVTWLKDQGIVKNQPGGRRYILGVMSDITLERENRDILVQRALHDELTGLPNRNLFIDRLKQIMLRAQRHTQIKYAVLFLDLDGFKAVNDTYGHATGDQVLIMTADRIRRCVREFDTVARLGGDEFVVLIEDPKDQVAVLALQKRIQAEIEKPCSIRGNVIQQGVSIGMTCCEGEFHDPNELINQADLLMYRDKARRKARR